MNKFSDMSTFVAVVDSGSISEASKKLGVAKSVISQRIHLIESHFNVVLFERGRKMKVTQSGQLFYERCLKILADIADTEIEIRQTKSSLSGRLRLSVPMAFTEAYLADVLIAFSAKYDNLRVDIEATDQFVNLADESFDAAIRLGQMKDSNLIIQPIAKNLHVLCASPAYLQQKGTPQHPSELQQHQGLLYINREPNGIFMLPVNERNEPFRIQPRLRTDSAHVLMAGALEGLGIAILPTFIAADKISSGELQIVLPQYSPSGGYISVAYRQSQRGSTKINTLVEFLSNSIGEIPIWDQKINNVFKGE
ncbi:LysR family transcriptional regulator [Acinetobacter sp. GN11]